MTGKIFINYRRDDAPGDARGIRDGLAARFGKSAVFMDVDNLLAGQRFDRELAKALDQCSVLVAVMGAQWLALLNERASKGERDYVREEIAAALKRDIPVIPVRAGREGVMPPFPRAEQLPADIRDLVLHQKHDVVHERFGRDIAGLVGAIEVHRGGGRSSMPWSRIAGGAFAILLLAGLIYAGAVYVPGGYGTATVPAGDPEALALPTNGRGKGGPGMDMPPYETVPNVSQQPPGGAFEFPANTRPPSPDKR